MWMDGWTDRRTYVRTDGRTCVRTDGRSAAGGAGFETRSELRRLRGAAGRNGPARPPARDGEDSGGGRRRAADRRGLHLPPRPARGMRTTPAGLPAGAPLARSRRTCAGSEGSARVCDGGEGGWRGSQREITFGVNRKSVTTRLEEDGVAMLCWWMRCWWMRRKLTSVEQARKIPRFPGNEKSSMSQVQAPQRPVMQPRGMWMPTLSATAMSTSPGFAAAITCKKRRVTFN